MNDKSAKTIGAILQLSVENVTKGLNKLECCILFLMRNCIVTHPLRKLPGSCMIGKRNELSFHIIEKVTTNNRNIMAAINIKF
jgi:hypothetical protein